jgi:hypothetical protein
MKRCAPAATPLGRRRPKTEVHAPERASAARGLDGGAERAQGVIDRLAQPRHGRLDRIETGDQRSSFGRSMPSALLTAMTRLYLESARSRPADALQ